ncbi:type VII secretion protein EccB, partial [Streptomyces milbemycinicus]
GRHITNGPVFLVTDTGLRYSVQSKNDSDSGKSKIGDDESGKDKAARTQQEVNKAQRSLGYQDVKPTPVPVDWSEFLPTGPRLDANSARQPQGS